MIISCLISKIKEWKEKRLRKKIILRLLVNRNHNPDGNRTAFEADNIIRYIKSGLPFPWNNNWRCYPMISQSS